MSGFAAMHLCYQLARSQTSEKSSKATALTRKCYIPCFTRCMSPSRVFSQSP